MARMEGVVEESFRRGADANVEDLDEELYFSDPFASLASLVDFAPIVSIATEQTYASGSKSVQEQLYFAELLRQSQRSSVLNAVFCSQFSVAIGLIQPALNAALLAVMKVGRARPLPPRERGVVDRNIRSVLLGSPLDWRRELSKHFEASVLASVVDWEELRRQWSLRNLLVHRGPVVDTQFRQDCPDGPPLGAPLEMTEREVLDAFDFAAGTRLAFLVAACDRVTPTFGQEFSSSHSPLAVVDLNDRRWWLAEGTARAALTFAGTARDRAFAQVNLWLAQAGRLGLESIQGEVVAWEVGELDPIFGLARLVLLGEYSKAKRSISRLLLAGDIDSEDVETWPLFANMRTEGLL